MKLGVFAVLFSEQPFEEALDYIKASGLNTVEIGSRISWTPFSICSS
jgi:sugar phosphate isomerase/epimerase